MLFGGGAGLGLLGIVLATRPAPPRSQPFVPGADGQVLERLPQRLGGVSPVALGARSLPPTADPATAERLAREDIRRYQATSDPRYLGHAEARLAAYWDAPEAPVPIVVLRAKVRASNHEFERALADLDQALARHPQDAQALFERATISTVLGRFEAASADCRALAALAPNLFAVACDAAVRGATGDARGAMVDLKAALSRASVSPGEGGWVESLLGELAMRTGDLTQAEACFKRSLLASPEDAYTLSALSDLLLDAKRAREVIPLLSPLVRIDGLLLRLAIAERDLGLPAAEAHVAELAERFADARLRGSAVHRREEARFELMLRGNAERALTLALANFAVQREPWDSRLVLEAARSARKPERAKEVVAFVRKSGLEEPTIAELVRSVTGAEP
jgi:tetratricopeptide (TPR) repeat protein